MGFDSSMQRSEPVALARTAYTVYPFPFADFGYDTGTDGRNGGLKTPKIAFGAQPDHTPTVRTSIPF
jgi:hypothetical protein